MIYVLFLFFNEKTMFFSSKKNMQPTPSTQIMTWSQVTIRVTIRSENQYLMDFKSTT